MKKHFIILNLLILVVATASAQVVPRGFVGEVLVGSPLSPVPGQEYTYQVGITPPDGNTFTWYVTQNFDFLEARDDVQFRELIDGDFLASGNIDATTGIGSAEILNLTWKSFEYNAEQPIFVVIYVVNADGTCSSENLRVFMVEPLHAFTLDIANLDNPGDYGANIEVCIDDIASALYNPATQEVDYDYGENILVYEVVAANWYDYWDLEVTFAGLQEGQEVVIEWAYDAAFTNAVPMTLTEGVYTSVTSIHPGGNLDPGGSVGPDGESIFIRAIIAHNDFEGTAAVQYTLAVNGVMPGGEDLSHETGEPDQFHDIALQTINARVGIANELVE